MGRPVRLLAAALFAASNSGADSPAAAPESVVAATPVVVTSGPEAVARGEYLLYAAGCLSCHTDEDNDGPALAGGRALVTRFGVFYTPNITPHPEHGIGRWSDAEFVRALKAGIAPQGHTYYPAFPYTSYAGMATEDALAIKAYLFSRPAVARPNRRHDLVWYASLRLALTPWKWLYFDPEPISREPRGAYLARALAHCDECHTPRDALGGLDLDRRYAGTADGPEGKTVPNITPDRKTGIGRWSADDLVFYFQTGLTPAGDSAGGLMAEVIDNGLSKLEPADLSALAEYVLSLPPIENPLKRSEKESKNKASSDW